MAAPLEYVWRPLFAWVARAWAALQRASGGLAPHLIACGLAVFLVLAWLL